MLSASPEALERGLLLTLLNRAPMREAALVQKLAVVVDSDGVDEKHEWMGDPPQMEIFEGARKFISMTSASLTITNVVYDAAVQIKRDDFRRNRSGSIQRQINKLANVVMNFPNKRLTDEIVAGTTNLAYDGESLYGDAHLARLNEGGTQDNLLAGTGTTVAQISTDIGSSVAGLRGIVAENGEPFFGDTELQLLFMCPPEMEQNFRTALNASVISQTSNVLQGIGELHVNNRLTDANDWYTFVLNPGFEALIWQDEQAIETDVIAEGSELWIRQRLAEFGASASLGAGPGLWQSTNKTVNT